MKEPSNPTNPKTRPMTDSAVTAPDSMNSLAAVADEEAAPGATGRVLLRPPGTDDLVRVMVEAQPDQNARAVADRLAYGLRVRLAPETP